jgi:hypothetical protein
LIIAVFFPRPTSVPIEVNPVLNELVAKVCRSHEAKPFILAFFKAALKALERLRLRIWCRYV